MNGARGRTTVVVDYVPIVAFLHSFEDCVAADHGSRAARAAAVTVDAIAIVAFLAGVANRVTAARDAAVRVASVAVEPVAVVALLAVLHGAIAAHGLEGASRGTAVS